MMAPAVSEFSALHDAADAGCRCLGCCAGREAAILPSEGVAANGKPIFNWDEAAAQLTRSGSSWSASPGTPVVVTYAFRSTAPSAMPEGTGGFQQFSAAQIVAAEAALQLWADVAGITFVRVGTGTSGPAAYSNSATILFANYTTETDPAAAFAFLPTNGSTSSNSVEGDIWVDVSEQDNANPVFGDYGPHVLAHEIGHAIGLSHPGTYNGGSPTYAADAEYWQDARMFTVMSYFGSSNTGGNIPLFAWGPQYHDIAAAQLLYGANTTTRTGDTVYGFNSNSGRDFLTITSASEGATFTVWDAGGVDTLDFSGYVENAALDLREGAFSNVGPTDAQRGPAVFNVSIARGVTIENGIGGSGNDTIIGNDVANLLIGNAGGDTLLGAKGGDRLDGRLGADRLDGGDAFDLSANGAQVYRIYQAMLDRAPDLSGFQFWTSSLDSGGSATSLVSGFFNSIEFQSVYGSLNNAQFVTVLYDNVLERAPDQSGLDFWLASLNGGATRQSVVLQFANSAEFTTKTAFDVMGFAQNVLYVDLSGQVYRVYQAMLDRAPDEGGFDFWTGSLASGGSLTSLVSGFFNSIEFQAVYGALNDAQFVSVLYNNVLERAPDQGGLDFWLASLNGGATRQSVVLQFSESTEFQISTASDLSIFLATGLPSFVDHLVGGSGDDALLGGRGADLFDFSLIDAGKDVVSGFEQIDTIRLAGFGYANAGAALSHFAQSGDDVIFADQGHTIVFSDTTLATVQAANLLFA